MKIIYIILFSTLLSTLSALASSEEGKHLFILSGQSNMVGLKPSESFIPSVKKEFGNDNTIVVHDAKGSQPIHRWYKNWQSPKAEEPKQIGDLYDRLMAKVTQAIEGQSITTVTFVWMQGERDARMGWGDVYEESFKGLLKQFSSDLKHEDINFVIGRLSDFGFKKENYPDWNLMREIQVKLAEQNPRGAWVNTDDLNDGLNRDGKLVENDIHYTAEGYKILGERFAEKAIQLIRKD